MAFISNMTHTGSLEHRIWNSEILKYHLSAALFSYLTQSTIVAKDVD